GHVAGEVRSDVGRRDELRAVLAELLDLVGLEVIVVRVRDEDDVRGLRRVDLPRIDEDGQPVALPPVGGLLVPGEPVQHAGLLSFATRRAGAYRDPLERRRPRDRLLASAECPRRNRTRLRPRRAAGRRKPWTCCGATATSG